MRLRRKAILGGAILACALAGGFGLGRASVGGGAVAAASPLRLDPRQQAAAAAARTRHSRETFLFAQTAAGGSLRGSGDRLTLTLTGVGGWVTRFADRPARDAQAVDVRDFLTRWRQRFATSPPNAVLSFRVAGEATPRTIVLELSRPRYDAAARTATYAARRIVERADALPGARHPRQPVVEPTPRAFAGASLFIDDSDDTETATVQDVHGSSWRLVWRADLSQCAGYGEATTSGSIVFVSYDSFDSGSCFFRRTYARFDAFDAAYGVKYGTITFDGDGNLESCTRPLVCAPATETNNEEIQILGVNGSP